MPEETAVYEVQPARSTMQLSGSDQYNQIIDLAISQGQLERIEKWMELKRQYEADEARKAFYMDLAEFNKTKPPVTKDKFNKRFNSWFTSLGNLLDTYSGPLGAHGLSISFPNPVVEENKMSVSVRLAHRLGHVEVTTITGPVDKAAIGKESGQASRNGIQDIKSTFTYLRSIGVEAVLGVSGTEATNDDDGNSVGGKQVETITDDQAANITALMKETGHDKDPMKKAFLSMFRVKDETELTPDQFKKAVAWLEGKRK